MYNVPTMKEVRIEELMPNEVMDIVKEIRKMGYVQGIDFDFEYNKPVYDYLNPENDYNRYTIFRFYKDEIATWFALRYQ